jgi:tRNA-specific 2-thiouridylase
MKSTAFSKSRTADRGTVLLGMSGGVDSSVAAALLVEQGYHVRGITLQVWEHEDESVAVSKRWQERGCCKVGIAKHVAKLLNIQHEVIDAREGFQKGVVDDFIHGYLTGTTPNPCVRCNERVKFGSLYHLAKDMGADFVATGHYARVQKSPDGTTALLKGYDGKKDQSYFLYRLSSSWLSQTLFPLGEMQKAEVWHRADAMGLPSEELKESQEICFVTQGDYREFIKENTPISIEPGNFTNTKGVTIGKHEGIAFYTPGQRKGLGVAFGERVYVQRVIPETNSVVLGSREELMTVNCHVSDLHLFDIAALENGAQIDVKVRYASPPVPAILEWIEDDTVLITFLSPQLALSPGQSAVFYQGNRVLGGGIIQRALPQRDEEVNGQSASPSF